MIFCQPNLTLHIFQVLIFCNDMFKIKLFDLNKKKLMHVKLQMINISLGCTKWTLENLCVCACECMYMYLQYCLFWIMNKMKTKNPY